jgi:signal transduction histidine kinase
VIAPFRFRGVRPYLIGFAGIAIATMLRHWLGKYLDEHLALVLDFLAVSLAAWTGGMWPAIATALLGALTGNFLFTQPSLSLQIENIEELVELVLFVAVSTVIGILAEITLRAVDRAKQAEAEKDNFMAAVAHEMRSPISVIYYANTLNRHSGSEQSNDQLDVIDRQVHHLNLMIEDLLDVSRIARGNIKLNRQLVEGASLVAGAVERARPTIESHKHRLMVQSPSKPLTLFVDPVRIEQVLANLLTNAAKYTPDGGEIVVRFEAAGDQGVFSVRDNGIGIAPDMLPRVFELFVQADAARDRTEGGLGIGLALARKIVEMHGGTVRATSGGADKGSEFTVSLPLETPAAKPALAQV